MLNIVYSLPHPADRLPSDGAGHLVRARCLVEALRDLGHKVTTVEAAGRAGPAPTVRRYRALSGRVPAGVARPVRDVGRTVFGLRAGRRLENVVRDIGPDVILETHVAFSLCGVVASRRTGVPLVVDDVAPMWEEAELYGVGIPRLADVVHRTVVRRARLVVAVSGTIAGILRSERGTGEGVVRVENGTDPDAFRAANESDPPPGIRRVPSDVTVVFVGSFQPYHRVDLLVRAAAELDESVRLVLVGAGRHLNACRDLARDLGVEDRVVFVGTVPAADVPRWLVHADIAVVPASNDYGNPMKLYDYVAAGLPVVAPDLAPVREVVDGEVALLFEPGSEVALREALAALAASPERRRAMAAAAARRAGDVSWNRRAEQLVDAIRAAGIGA